MKIVEIEHGLLVREDGFVKNTLGHAWSKDWHKGTPHGNGYLRVTIPQTTRLEFVHRLVAKAFLPEYAKDLFVDHINGDRQDNRVSNIKIVNRRENMTNLQRHRDNMLVGASYSKSRSHLPKPWRSSIMVNKKNIHLGYFCSEMEAHEAYIKFVNENGL